MYIHILGPAIEVRARDGNSVEAQVQLGIWMTGLVMWAFTRRTTMTGLPPPVGCAVVGADWKFYIAIPVQEPWVFGRSGEFHVRATKTNHQVHFPAYLGPLPGLSGSTEIVEDTMAHLMKYTAGQYGEAMFRAITVES